MSQDQQLQQPVTVLPVIEQCLTKIDAAVQKVYLSQESLAYQLDKIELLLAEFTQLKTPSIQIYIDKLVKIKELIDAVQRRVIMLQQLHLSLLSTFLGNYIIIKPQKQSPKSKKLSDWRIIIKWFNFDY